MFIPRTYYVRHSTDCVAYKDYKFRTKTFRSQSAADNAAYSYYWDWDKESEKRCTGMKCRTKVVPILMLPSDKDTYWDSPAELEEKS
jgi:hypothetical protein